jgi:hypothetical protein
MTSERFPNLFILGAPKCGTTAMSHYLAGHPDIFMSEEAGVKEPFFYCSDLELSHIHWRIRDRREYLRLFEQAPSTAKYIGEASPLYLFSEAAIPAVIESCPRARFVVMLRNPVELAASLHNQHARFGADIPDFERAWRLQGERANGRSIPAYYADGALLQYGKVAKVGAQIERLFAAVDRARVHCIFYDDFKKDPGRSYRRLLEFLNVADDGRSDFRRFNGSVTYRWHGLETSLKRIRRLRTRLGLSGGLGIHAAINRFNASEGRRILRPQFDRELRAYFRRDIALLSELTGRNLSAWQSG